MRFEPVKLVHVYYNPEDKKILVGRLALKSRRIFFEYDPHFLSLHLNLSPFKLPLKEGVLSSDDLAFDGLFGLFNDSLPDGWGRLLLDRTLAKHNVNPNSLSPLDRLCFVGKQGMGALTYEPEAETTPIISDIDLDNIADEVHEFQTHDDARFVEDLLHLGGSSGGARPKVLLNLDEGFWLVKFCSSTDPKDIGAIEYAYHLMALEAGLDLPEAKLFASRKGLGFFGTKRFDRTQNQSVHMHSLSGLLHADHRTPSLDYEIIMKATMHLTRDITQCEKQFRQCVFNVLSHNRDDHAKNFSFIMDHDGTWRVSPAYDLTFSTGPGAEHCTMIMGEGKNPGISQLLKLASLCDIKKSIALDIVDEVKSVVNNWKAFAEQAGVHRVSAKMIGAAIQKIIKENF